MKNNRINDRINRESISPEKISKKTNKLRLNGFYYTKYIQPIKGSNDSMKFIAPLVLYNDGTLKIHDYIGNQSGHYDYDRKKIKDTSNLKMPNLKNHQLAVDYFKCYELNLEPNNRRSGVYKINGNFITLQINADKELIHEKGIILNDTTFLINKELRFYKEKITTLNKVYYFSKNKTE